MALDAVEEVTPGFLSVTDRELGESQAVCSARGELLSILASVSFLKYLLAYGNRLSNQRTDGRNPETHRLWRVKQTS